MYKRIRDLREDRDLSQAEIAKILRISQSTYSRYESGYLDLPSEILISLSKILVTKYIGESSIFKNNEEYYLLINNNPHSPEEFNQICNIICEYGRYTNFKKNPKAYLNEHYELILSEDALQQLSTI